MLPALAALLLQGSSLALTPSQFWHTPYGVGAWIPMAGDADGDGRADLLALSTGGDGRIEMARTSPFGKPVANAVALQGFGARSPVSAAACGPFRRGAAADVMAVFADGSVRLAWGMKPGTAAFLHNDAVAQVPPEAVPRAPARMVVADFDGDRRADALVLGADGRLLLLRNAPGPHGELNFDPVPLRAMLPDVHAFVAGDFGPELKGRVVWTAADGEVLRAGIEKGVLMPSVTVTRAAPGERLVVGRFRGFNLGADLVVGRRLLPGGEEGGTLRLDTLPAPGVGKDDRAWVAADVDGNGKDDLVRFAHGPEGWVGDDTLVQFAYDPGREDPGYYSSSNDGLPDAWKLGHLHPGGLDLKTMGCKVGHRDLIVELERFENVDLQDLRNNMNRAAQYYASIPLRNPDGTTGIALHVMYREPWPMKDHDRIRAHFNDLFPRPGNRGIAHMMFAERDGPLDAAIDAGVGRFNGGWAVFVHEVGHQLDLVHDGFHGNGTGWGSNTGAAIYPSLMSYTYSYGLNDSGEAIGYSDGARASLVLDPRHLSERLPFPYETVRFLGAEPYHFRLQRTPDDQSTLIDWDWNGVFGEPDVAANVNSTHGTDFGTLYGVARTETAPALALHDGHPLLVYTEGSTLAVRTWLGRNRDTEGARWSDAATDYQAALTGDATVAYLGDNASWIAYPTAKGVAVRKAVLDGAGVPHLGPASVLAKTLAAQPTLAAVDGRLALFLWHGKTLPVGLALLRPRGEGLVAGGERPLDLLSETPVGATAGRPGRVWLGRMEVAGREFAGRSEVVEMKVDATGGATVVHRAIVEGLYVPLRPTLLWREDGPKLPDGRIFLLGAGGGYAQYVTMNTPYPDFQHGWMIHRYRDPGFTARSNPGAILFQGDILVAFRHGGGGNDPLEVAFYGTGAIPAPTGDFDDLGHIRDFGLAHSIRELTK